jgi:hypothetical protein
LSVFWFLHDAPLSKNLLYNREGINALELALNTLPQTVLFLTLEIWISELLEFERPLGAQDSLALVTFDLMRRVDFLGGGWRGLDLLRLSVLRRFLCCWF